jgi:hypothetical protein
MLVKLLNLDCVGAVNKGLVIQLRKNIDFAIFGCLNLFMV